MTRPALLALALLLVALGPAVPLASADEHCATEIRVYSAWPTMTDPGWCGCSCVVSVDASMGPDRRYIVGEILSISFVRDSADLPDTLHATIEGLGHTDESVVLVKDSSISWSSPEIHVEGEGSFRVTVFPPREPSQTTVYEMLAGA